MKKGMALWEVLIWAIILVVFALLLIYVFRNSLNKEDAVLGGQIDGAKDCDGDFVPNAFDKCCDTKGGSVDSNGCAGATDTKVLCNSLDKCKTA